MLRFRAWLAALVKGRRSSFSILANALTPDVKLAVIQEQALLALRAATNDDVQRCAVVCLRRIDAAGLHSCRALSCECASSPCPASSATRFFTRAAAHAAECQFRPVACANKGCAKTCSAMHYDEHLSVCEWTAIRCVLCGAPVAACLMQVRTTAVCSSRSSPRRRSTRRSCVRSAKCSASSPAARPRLRCRRGCGRACPPPRVLKSSPLVCARQGQHNADAAVQHAHFLLQRYITRQQLLARINDDVTALLASDTRQLLHVSEVNAGLGERASEVRAAPYRARARVRTA